MTVEYVDDHDTARKKKSSTEKSAKTPTDKSAKSGIDKSAKGEDQVVRRSSAGQVGSTKVDLQGTNRFTKIILKYQKSFCAAIVTLIQLIAYYFMNCTSMMS